VLYYIYDDSDEVVIHVFRKPSNAYVAEDGVTSYVAEDGCTYYVKEA
jgi:hypothetical protein